MAGRVREVFFLKYRDTRPAFRAVLRNPDKSVHNLTGATAKLHVTLAGTTTVLTFNLNIVGDPLNGTVEYPWVANDWDAGKLPKPPGAEAQDHNIEIESVVTSPTPTRTTFPNDTYYILRITPDLGQS